MEFHNNLWLSCCQGNCLFATSPKDKNTLNKYSTCLSSFLRLSVDIYLFMGCLSISTFIISFIYLYSSLLGILTCLKTECEEFEHFKHFRICIIIVSKEFKALEPMRNIMWDIIYALILNHKHWQISLDIFHQILTAISVTSHFAIKKKLKEDNCIPRRLWAVL